MSNVLLPLVAIGTLALVFAHILWLDRRVIRLEQELKAIHEDLVDQDKVLGRLSKLLKERPDALDAVTTRKA